MPVSPRDPTGDPRLAIPLRPADFLVLLVLAAGARHGYGIMQDVEHHSEGRVQLEAGSLYRTIRRLEEEGMLTESARRPAADRDDERRRYYRLTAYGRAVVAAEADRLRALVRLAEAARLLVPDVG
ncbi:MAG: helix-turn-helix transcriptional regulator [Gemmatimonadota bacterium]